MAWTTSCRMQRLILPWVMESSHLMPRKDVLLAECARVMRPGARMVPATLLLRRELPLAEVLSRPRDFVPLHYAFGHAKMESLDTYERLVTRTGFRLTELIDISDQTFGTFVQWRQRLEKSSKEVRAQIGDEGYDHFWTSCENSSPSSGLSGCLGMA